jgi:hypothetical protein
MSFLADGLRFVSINDQSLALPPVRCELLVRRRLPPCKKKPWHKVLVDVICHAEVYALQMTPNPSFNRTRYGKRRKPELRHMVHHLSSGLRRLPPRAG